MAAETTTTYTFQAPIRSVFSPSHETPLKTDKPVTPVAGYKEMKMVLQTVKSRGS